TAPNVKAERAKTVGVIVGANVGANASSGRSTRDAAQRVKRPAIFNFVPSGKSKNPNPKAARSKGAGSGVAKAAMESPIRPAASRRDADDGRSARRLLPRSGRSTRRRDRAERSR